jgi:hypothetical protein
MKLNDTYYDKALGRGVIVKIDETGFYVRYENDLKFYEHPNVERKLLLTMSLITLLFWTVVVGLIYWVW